MRIGWFALALLAGVAEAALPIPPRYSVDTTFTPSTCTTTVASGGNVQTAITNAVAGDTVCLEAGATFTGNFTLPNKAGASYITIRTATPEGTFPRPGTRVGPSNASLMAKLTAGSGSIIATQNDAHHFRFVGIEITPSAYLNSIVDLAAPSGLEGDVSSYLIFDRCYIHGHATNGSRRGVSMQSSWVAVIDSYISDIKENGADAQAIAAWTGPGPFKIVNNYLEASGENVLFGGADSSSAAFQPSDIEFRRNHVFKPLTWWPAHASYAGTYWTVKNHFELKCARRVVIENNLFQNVWLDAQTGNSQVWNVINQGGSAPWTTVEDVLFRNNVTMGAFEGIRMGRQSYDPSDIQRRIAIQNNLFLDMTSEWSDFYETGRLMIIGNDPNDLTIEHNTVADSDVRGIAITINGDIVNLINRYNIFQFGTEGWRDTPGNTGDAAFATDAPGAIYTKNVHYDQTDGSAYSGHSGNYFIANTAAVGFVNYAGGNYRLTPAGTYTGLAINGRDLGAFFPSVGQTAFTASLDAKGTVGVLRFGMPGMSSSTSCTIRYGASSTTSTSGPSTRTVVLTGLTPGSTYGVTVDCGDAAGAVIPTDVVASTPSGGDRTVAMSLGAPSAALTAMGAARCTLDYDDNAALSSPISVQDTTCSTGGSANMTVPAGISYARWRWQTSGDVVIATGTAQPYPVE